MALPAVTTDVVVVFGLILVAVVLFATGAVSPDITAISVLVAVVVLELVTEDGTVPPAVRCPSQTEAATEMGRRPRCLVARSTPLDVLLGPLSWTRSSGCSAAGSTETGIASRAAPALPPYQHDVPGCVQ